MISPKVIFPCDHIVTEIKSEFISAIKTKSDVDLDLLTSDGASVSSILSASYIVDPSKSFPDGFPISYVKDIVHSGSSENRFMYVNGLEYDTEAALTLCGKTTEEIDGEKSPDNPSTIRGIGNFFQGLSIAAAKDLSDPFGEIRMINVDFSSELFLYSLPNGTTDNYAITDGTITKKITKVFLDGSQTLTYSNSQPSDTLFARFAYDVGPYSGAARTSANIICSHFVASDVDLDTGEKTWTLVDESASHIYLLFQIQKSRLSGWNDEWNNIQKSDAINSWIVYNPVTILYEVETPVIEITNSQKLTLFYNQSVIAASGDILLKVDLIRYAPLYEKYRRDIDFSLYGNYIKWLTPRRPQIGKNFFVEFLKNSRITTSPKDVKDCQRCSGNGWYVNVFSNMNKSIDKVSGINKLVQDFIKILYTRKTSDSDYGTELTNIPGRELYSEEEAYVLVAETIRDAEYQYKKLQLDIISSGYDIPNSEILSSATIINAQYNLDESYMYLEISLTSMEPGQQAQISLEI